MNNQQLKPQRNKPGNPPKAISGIINRVLKGVGLGREYNGWMVVTEWADIVGPAIAKVARAVRFEDGCLEVAVADSSWRQELSMQQAELLKKIHSRPYGAAVTRIRLVQGGKGTLDHGN